MSVFESDDDHDYEEDDDNISLPSQSQDPNVIRQRAFELLNRMGPEEGDDETNWPSQDVRISPRKLPNGSDDKTSTNKNKKKSNEEKVPLVSKLDIENEYENDDDNDDDYEISIPIKSRGKCRAFCFCCCCCCLILTIVVIASIGAILKFTDILDENPYIINFNKTITNLNNSTIENNVDDNVPLDEPTNDDDNNNNNNNQHVSSNNPSTAPTNNPLQYFGDEDDEGDNNNDDTIIDMHGEDSEDIIGSNIDSVQNNFDYNDEVDTFEIEDDDYVVVEMQDHECNSFTFEYFDTLMEDMAHADLFCDAAQGCHCKSPLLPYYPTFYTPEIQKQWDSAFLRNQKLIRYVQHKELDVVLFGDSITEHLLGTGMGSKREKWSGHEQYYRASFYHSHGGSVEGVALGIGGDRCNNLLYRLQNGELPESLNPKIFWILIGTNDLGGDHCSVESIVAGNIQIVKEIQQRRPNSTIVINSILPRLHSLPDVNNGDNHGDDDVTTTTPNWDENAGIWKKLSEINSMLSCFAMQNKDNGVLFFNASNLFLLNQDTQEGSFVNATLYMDPVHLSAHGSRVWCEAIAHAVQKLVRLDFQ